MEYEICECCGKPKKKTVIREDFAARSNKTEQRESQVVSGQKGIYDQPVTDLARTWAGHRYGLQALKPAIETVLIFQKPYEGRPIDNITRTGAGALWVDGARIPANGEPTGANGSWGFTESRGWNSNNIPERAKIEQNTTQGRWPSNFYLDTEAARRLDEQSGTLTSNSGKPFVRHKDRQIGAASMPVADGESDGYYGDSGGASRFFFRVEEQLDDADPVRYVAKASRAERDAGLEGMPLIELKTHGEMGVDTSGNSHNTTGQKPALARNPHPTVKPLALTRYLATLLLPPAEYAPRRLFVPFAGVASEAIGAMQAGWEQVEGVEITEEYLPIARARIEYWRERNQAELIK